MRCSTGFFKKTIVFCLLLNFSLPISFDVQYEHAAHAAKRLTSRQTVVIGCVALLGLTVLNEAVSDPHGHGFVYRFFRDLGLFAKLEMAGGNNFYLVDKNPATGFALFRASDINNQGMLLLKEHGVTEIFVLSGDADEHEFKHRDTYPALEVVSNEEQTNRVPLALSFIKKFDQWIQEAQAKGKRICIRCNWGAHRTGRLAAYYRMKYQGWTAQRAYEELEKEGIIMWKFPHLYWQVVALEDYIHSRPCSVEPQYCVRENK